MKFLSVFLLAVVLLTGSYLTVVRVVDTRAELADPLKPRHFPTVVINSRTEKLRLFRAYRQGGEITGLVLGSSRAMKLDPPDLDRGTGLRFFNFAVDSACAEDYLAIYRWAVAQGARPKMLLIGLDVEALHDNETLDPRLETNRPLVAALGADGAPLPGRWERFRRWATLWKSTLTLDYWRDTRRSFKARFHPPQAEKVFSRLEPDSNLRYPKWEWDRANGHFDTQQQIAASCPEYLERFTGMKALSPRRQALLEKLITEARAQGVEVKIWITTLHPVVVERLEQKTRYDELLQATRLYLQDLERHYGIAGFDFSSPELFGASLTGWYDGAHLDESNLALLRARLLGGRS
jgi:hypothetical protein